MNQISGFTLILGEASMDGRLFDLDFQLLADSFLTMLAVLALFALLSYLLFNPAREMLRKRKEKIAAELENAASDMAEASSLKKDYEFKLQNINKEAEELMNEARRKAQANELKIMAEAREEAARIISRARTEIELEKKKAADDMKKEIVSIASIMAGKVVSASIDTSIQNHLIDETLKEIGDKTWLS